MNSSESTKDLLDLGQFGFSYKNTYEKNHNSRRYDTVKEDMHEIWM